jgi:hypothetical protein
VVRICPFKSMAWGVLRQRHWCHARWVLQCSNHAQKLVQLTQQLVTIAISVRVAEGSCIPPTALRTRPRAANARAVDLPDCRISVNRRPAARRGAGSRMVPPLLVSHAP